MKSFLSKVVLFLVLLTACVFIGAVIASALVNSRDFKNDDTESSTLVMRENTHYDLAILGISHARNFSRHGNHVRMEQILNKKILNLGQGNATCGVREQRFYLDYCYTNNIKIDTVLYILSPPLMYANQMNLSAKTFEFERFSFDFFFQYLAYDTENKSERLFHYVRSKLSKEWINHKPFSKPSEDGQLHKLDSAKIKEGFQVAYPEGLMPEVFAKNSEGIRQTVEDAKAHGTVIIFVIPPALFGKWAGHEETLTLAKELNAKYGVSYYDFSETVFKPEFYYDHHHLNTEGVVFFTQEFLKPIL